MRFSALYNDKGKRKLRVTCLSFEMGEKIRLAIANQAFKLQIANTFI